MSMKHLPAGQPQFRTVRGSKPQGTAVAVYAHDETQLLFAESGMMQVYTNAGCWFVPLQLAVWIPTAR